MRRRVCSSNMNTPLPVVFELCCSEDSGILVPNRHDFPNHPKIGPQITTQLSGIFSLKSTSKEVYKLYFNSFRNSLKT